METGYDPLLQYMKKGVTAKEQVQGGRNVVESGISLSEYIMPGVGGRTMSEEHIVETAGLLNIVKPDFIRVRTFALHPLSPLNKMIQDGIFEPMTDEEMVAEIRLLVTHLDETHTYFSCGDYGRNLLMQVDGYLDEKKAYMLEELDRFLSLDKEQKQAYSLLRRTSYRNYPLDVVFDEAIMKQIRPEIEKLEKSGEDGFNNYIQSLMSYQMPQPQGGEWK